MDVAIINHSLWCRLNKIDFCYSCCQALLPVEGMKLRRRPYKVYDTDRDVVWNTLIVMHMKKIQEEKNTF